MNAGLFAVNLGRKLGTQAGVHLIEGFHLTWGPLNTGFTVIKKNKNHWPKLLFQHASLTEYQNQSFLAMLF